MKWGEDFSYSRVAVGVEPAFMLSLVDEDEPVDKPLDEPTDPWVYDPDAPPVTGLGGVIGTPAY